MQNSNQEAHYGIFCVLITVIMPPKKRSKNARGSNKKPRIEKTVEKVADDAKASSPAKKSSMGKKGPGGKKSKAVGSKRSMPKSKSAPTVKDVLEDPLSILASETWTTVEKPEYDADLVMKVLLMYIHSFNHTSACISLYIHVEYCYIVMIIPLIESQNIIPLLSCV